MAGLGYIRGGWQISFTNAIMAGVQNGCQIAAGEGFSENGVQAPITKGGCKILLESEAKKDVSLKE